MQICYQCKGMAVFEITRENREQYPQDEILHYQMVRYINSTEKA